MGGHPDFLWVRMWISLERFVGTENVPVRSWNHGTEHGVDWTIDTAVILKPKSQHPALAMFMREVKRRSVESAAKWARPAALAEGARTRKKKPQSVKGSSRNLRSSNRAI